MRFAPRLLVLMLLAFATTGIGESVASAATGHPKPNSQEAAFARIARNDLRLAKKAYGPMRIPEMPHGFRLLHVSWPVPATSVGLVWHRAADDAYVHLWQTHDPDRLLGTVKGLGDPSDPATGTPLTIGGAPWVQNTINACAQTICLGHRYPNGDVVSMNGSLPLTQLSRIAARL